MALLQHFDGGNGRTGPLIGDGDLVVVYERHDQMKAVKVLAGKSFQNRFGVFRFDDWIGKPFGSKVLSVAKPGVPQGFVHLLALTPELWTKVLTHRTQILYMPDIAVIVSQLNLCPGCTVLESGTGSGSLTHSLARAVAPTGHVWTFEFHELRAQKAREEFEQNGLGDLVTVTVRDIQGEGFPAELHSKADAVFLDLPGPWMAVPSVSKCIKPNGMFCSFSPCIEQVHKCSEALRQHDFTDLRPMEILLRTYDIQNAPQEREDRSDAEKGTREDRNDKRPIWIRPAAEGKGHTGYLLFARKWT